MAKEKNTEVVKEVAVEQKQDHFTLVASFPSIDAEGYKVRNTYKSEGVSLEEVVAKLDFPKGVNALTTVVLTKNGSSYERTIAPHNARRILEHKNVAALEAIYRGI